VTAAVLSFLGDVEQIPPMHSALKREGVPLYRLARKGEEVERKPRRVTISQIEILRCDLPLVEVRVRCSKGTYIRTLAEDIGVALGTGGHLAGLRRTAAGRFALERAATLEDLERMAEAELDGRLLPLRELLAGWPEVALDEAAEGRFSNGQTVPLPPSISGVCAVYGGGGRVLGLGSADGAGSLRPLRLVAATQAAEKHQKTL
jgi:tRNA pseudouridine55 synthase